MVICPYCDAENIEGADLCGQCGQSLTELSLPAPATSVEANLLRDRIDLLNPKPPLTATPGTSVGEVLQMMAGESVGCVMIVENDELVGIFSERDALLRLNAEAGKLAMMPIRDYMTPHPETLEARDKIAFALHKMDLGGYRHIPILADGRLVGVVSIRDILAYLTQRIAASH